ncbi:hypothetical protein KSF_110110 [Reticulibacter mediterranei]|uniref:DUF4388 domain-containing protein n=1 Tax=Reticulibacter mediterranei TaxID=2778369 RepID=A0A8J3IYR0_9CHLR|nr:hypothetical protein [Reticulibacter mediterranei]GHP00964.1 hypothetical protein KSF_110110 [Reticulibacter mediterranei]
MGNDWIDASLGLTFSLPLFERYRKNGLLQAELHHVPGIRGRCKGYLHLVEGKVILCQLEDKQGQRHQVNVAMLIQLDNERGPFEWVLIPSPPPPQPVPRNLPSPSSMEPVLNSPIPQKIGSLDLEKLEGWTHRQKMMLSIVFDVVDGQRSIEDIKTDVPLPPNVVEEALRILLALKAIIIPNP